MKKKKFKVSCLGTEATTWITVMTLWWRLDSATFQVVNLTVNLLKSFIKTGVTLRIVYDRLRPLVSERMTNLLSKVHRPDTDLWGRLVKIQLTEKKADLS